MEGVHDAEVMSATRHRWMVRGITLVILIMLVIAVVIMGPRLLSEYNASITIEKKSDIEMIAQSVRTYVLNTQTVPQNVIAGWCVIGQSYPSGQCLAELADAKLPISPDKEPYYYYAAKNHIVVATRLNPAEDGPGRSVGACAPDYSDTTWCVELNRAELITPTVAQNAQTK